MVDILRLAFMAVSFVVVTLAAALLQPALAHDLGLHHWNLTIVRKHLLGERKTLEEVNAMVEQDRAIQQRIAHKTAIVQELLAGHLTLFEAAALFRQLNEATGGAKYNCQFAGLSEEESACQQVIMWAGVETREIGSNETSEFVQDLQEQLHRHKEENSGAVFLPEPPSF